MALYAILDNNVIIDIRNFDNVPETPGKPQRRYLPVEDIRPPFDKETQVRTGPEFQIEKDRVLRVWSTRDKTLQELAAEGDERLSKLDRLTFMVLFQHENRIRALEGKAAITIEQFRNALKNA